MDIRLLEEVVAVLADVVELGVDGGIVAPPAFRRHPTVSLAAAQSGVFLIDCLLIDECTE